MSTSQPSGRKPSPTTTPTFVSAHTAAFSAARLRVPELSSSGQVLPIDPTQYPSRYLAALHRTVADIQRTEQFAGGCLTRRDTHWALEWATPDSSYAITLPPPQSRAPSTEQGTRLDRRISALLLRRRVAKQVQLDMTAVQRGHHGSIAAHHTLCFLPTARFPLVGMTSEYRSVLPLVEGAAILDQAIAQPPSPDHFTRVVATSLLIDWRTIAHAWSDTAQEMPILQCGTQFQVNGNDVPAIAPADEYDFIARPQFQSGIVNAAINLERGDGRRPQIELCLLFNTHPNAEPLHSVWHGVLRALGIVLPNSAA